MKYEILKRTFKALNYPRGSIERKNLNTDVLTSEYYTTNKWLLRVPFIMSDDTPHPTQKYLDYDFKTKKEAMDVYLSFMKINKVTK